ncbi:substrate-binding domain-containing protein [Vallicoccus soli]|uniref:Sugar ABC transporter substrate-binding protein n=1 Tax=Vallicoccus soli TaxID=2339232 RepID=A0A3A3Z186_9ACTN|nr:substrate-binding domain-containing protein [Vallicoccus soli]RJK97015.1 sugar ABC transporter substrate-binding protein [Vallicoccus soli]
MARTDLPALAALGRRRFLLGGAAIGAGAVLAGCTGNEPESTSEGQAAAPAGDNAETGRAVTIGFSAPAADHGWMAAITDNAESRAEQFEDVTLEATEGTNDPSAQIAAVETLLNGGIDALVILPFDGNALTEIGRRATDQGIPVINLDRVFSTPLAYRTYIGGDNYGMGVAAGNFIGQQLRDAGVSNPIIGEIAGIDALPLTQDRSRGFREALATFGFQVGPRQAAEFTVESGESVTANLLQAAPRLDALWNHDDDQGIGVLAAIDNAGRDEFIMVGGAGSANAMELIQSGDSVLKATVTYPPTMAGDAVSLARLVAQGRGMSDLVEPSIPSSIVVASGTVTADNVEEYLPLGFRS